MNKMKRQFTVDAQVARLEEALSFVEEMLEEYDCPMKTMTQILISVEEIFVNVANYGYPKGKTGTCTFVMEVTDAAEGAKKMIRLCISDEGIPFNPLKKEDPDITLSAEERDIGGLGIWMIKQSMDRVEYRYENNQNQLWIEKAW